MQYTQDALFPDTEVVGTGEPQPWPNLGEAAPESQVKPPKPFKIELPPLPFPDEDAA